MDDAKAKALIAAYNQARSLGYTWDVIDLDHDWEALQVALDGRAEGRSVPLPSGFSIIGNHLTNATFSYALGEQTEVPVGATQWFNRTVVNRFMPHKLIINEPQKWVVADMRAGTEPLFDGHVLSAQILPPVRKVLLVPGMDLSVAVTNVHDKPAVLSAVVIGSVCGDRQQ